jgi:NAD(P)-dependent dehydrogenase (short-subunit alcohol dehydrogenase family)
MADVSREIRDRESDVVVVTGGNSGIGFECARQLARHGRHVVIASRNRAASAEAVRRITAESGAAAASEMGLDLGSLAAVRAFAQEVEARDLPLGAVVCNAGLQITKGPQVSPDGFELTFAVNHLGHFLLVNLLLARLLAHAPSRVVVVASGVHDPNLRTGMPKAAISDLDTLATTGEPRRGAFDGRLAYVNSKLCNLWFAYELERRIAASGVRRDGALLTVNGFDPGLVPGSGLARDYPPALRFIWDRILPGVARVLTLATPTINPAWKAGQALANLVVDPALARVTGKYFPSHARWHAAPSSDASYEVERARALWDESARLCRLAADESPLAEGRPAHTGLGNTADLPTVAEVIAPILLRVPAERQPLLIAIAERRAAARYRGWAADMADETRRAELLACATREEEIATRVEALYPDAATIQRDMLAANPDLEEVNRTLFAGRPLLQQFVIQAEGERLGAATWRAFARRDDMPGARPVFLACAELEERSAVVLEAIVGEHRRTT